MKLKILESAIEDLHRGREFYARHGEGVGEYFLDSVFSDIDSLSVYRVLDLRRNPASLRDSLPSSDLTDQE